MVSPREYREHIASKKTVAKQENVDAILAQINDSLLNGNFTKRAGLFLIDIVCHDGWSNSDYVEVVRQMVLLGWQQVSRQGYTISFCLPDVGDFLT